MYEVKINDQNTGATFRRLSDAVAYGEQRATSFVVVYRDGHEDGAVFERAYEVC